MGKRCPSYILYRSEPRFLEAVVNFYKRNDIVIAFQNDHQFSSSMIHESDEVKINVDFRGFFDPPWTRGERPHSRPRFYAGLPETIRLATRLKFNVSGSISRHRFNAVVRFTRSIVVVRFISARSKKI